VTSPKPAYQIYGRRKGKPLRRHHLALMETLLPQVSVSLADPLAATTTHRWLEIGFGGGEHLAHQAALHPEVSMFGAEPFLNGVAKLLAEIDSRKLANVRIHYGDARPLLDALPDSSFERIYLLYPDPWPKERQKKRRFVNSANLAHFHRILQPHAIFCFASDIENYVDWARDCVAQSGLFRETGNPATPFEDWLPTRYETKGVSKGHISQYLRFVRL
jgi:tRNA (guanine-N7-)-methyltransferase